MPINMNLMRPINGQSLNRQPLNILQNVRTFQVARPQGLRQIKPTMFNVGIISNVVHSKPGCGSCGK